MLCLGWRQRFGDGIGHRTDLAFGVLPLGSALTLCQYIVQCIQQRRCRRFGIADDGDMGRVLVVHLAGIDIYADQLARNIEPLDEAVGL